MTWMGQEGYLAATTEDWIVAGDIAGSVKRYGYLTVNIALK